MPFLAAGDIQIYYEMQGAGRQLLIISGSSADLRRPPTLFHPVLVRYFTILAYDQRGLGQTSRPDVPYAMADYAADADALLEAIGWRRCMVLGVSFGGMVAQEFAIRYPHRVERLALACTSSGGAGGASYPLHELQDLPPRDRARQFLAIFDTRRDKQWQAENPAEMERLIDQRLASHQIGSNEPNREIGARRVFEARAKHDTYARLLGLTLPVYICGGRYDGIAPVDRLRAIQGQIRGARLELFEGGHGFLTQDPAAYERIAAFLRGDWDTQQ